VKMTTPAEKVRVSVAMNPPILLLDYSHQVTLSGTAVVRVEAPSSTKKNHAPIDLIMLINISNSMSWPAASSPTTETPSTRLDLLKRAMKFMTRQLDDGDRLAIVAFNDQVVKEHSTGLLEMSGSGRMAIEKKVDGLVAKGDTAFKPSLEYAVKLLDERADKKRVGFIVLISDGLDKQVKWSDESIGANDPVRALLRKYAVHTLGLCKGDDPKSLHYIAEISYGTYSSVDLADGGKQITEALAVCVAGFKTVVAVGASVDIRSSSLQVTRIDSGGYTVRSPSSGGIYVGTLYAGEVKDFVAHFSYRTGAHARGYHTTLNGINAVVTCRPSATTSIITDTCSVALPLHVADTATLPANPCPPHPVALQQAVRFKAADLLVSVLREFHALKEEAGGGGGDDTVLQAVAASSLGKKWAEFKKSDESWKQAPGNLLDLGGIDGDMDAVVGSLKRGSGVWCAYSWLSSHQMQRATTATGLPAADHAGPFCTPAMAAMVREAHKQMAEEASAQEAGTWVVGKRAAELLDDINKRFELWCKVDHDLPPSHQDEGGESSDLAAGLRGDINRARQHHIYLAAHHAIKQWRSFLASVEKTHGHGPDM
ncbi:unnamed protein product, partial [Urochloa decumbens]